MPHAWLLFSAWRHPRMISGYLIACAILLVAQLPFLVLLPRTAQGIAFEPLAMAVPCVALILGPGGVWAAPTAVILADLICGAWSAESGFRAVGAFSWALTVFSLWDSSCFRRVTAQGVMVGWSGAIRFSLVAGLGAASYGAWCGLGIEWSGKYPLGYAVLLQAAQSLLPAVLISPLLFRALSREVVGHLGSWHAAMSIRGRFARWRPLSIVVVPVATTGAWLLAVLTGWPAAPPSECLHYGLFAGNGSAEWVAALLVIQLAALLLP